MGKRRDDWCKECATGSKIRHPDCEYYCCSLKGCNKQIKKYNKYCKYHRCQEFSCSELAIGGYGVCLNHQCQARNCTKGTMPDKIFCSYHACKCQCPVWGKCPDHQCSISDCYNQMFQQFSGKAYCEIHTCQICNIPIIECTKHEYLQKISKWIVGCTHQNEPGKICKERRAWLGTHYDEYCLDCLKFCEIETCCNFHAPGTPRCLDHACQCFGGTKRRQYCQHRLIDRSKIHWRCKSPSCQVCPISFKSLIFYFCAGLECDTPILESLYHSVTYK